MGWKILTNTGAIKQTDASGVSTPTRTILSGSGTYTLPTGCTEIIVECVGGGAGGGGVNVGSSGQVAVGGGGGGGAYSASRIANPSASYAYVVGGGGNGGTAGANNGNDGSDTTFGSTIVVAKGGSHGNGAASSTTVQVTTGGLGGLASSGTGDVKVDGGSGGNGNAPAASVGESGFGGAGAVYGAIRQGVVSLASGGGAGDSYGGGGTGAIRTSSTGSHAGGNGAAGIIVVTEYYGTPNTIGTFPQQVTAPAFVASGLTGATATSRYAGATTSGPPSSGSFGVGDFVVDQTGNMWVCTAAGSPGTWIAVGVDKEIGYDQITSNFTISSTSAPGDTLIAGSAYTFDGQPVMAQFYCLDIIPPTASGNGVNISLYEGSTQIALFSQAYTTSTTPMRIPGNGWYRFTPTAGSHTYSVKVYSTSLTGTPQILAGTGAATAPAFLRLTKV